MQLKILNNEQPDVCKECDGACCKTLPGTTHPSEWGKNFATIEKALLKAFQTGHWCVDWWEGDLVKHGGLSQVYFVRPVVAGKEGKIRDASWGGTCNFLKETGCSLAFDRRPYQCRALIPNRKNGRNYCGGPDKERMARVWRPYQTMLNRIMILFVCSDH